MWLTIVLSFGFYLPVVLWADVNPLIGMLMIPKTCAYVWTVLIGVQRHERLRTARTTETCRNTKNNNKKKGLLHQMVQQPLLVL